MKLRHAALSLLALSTLALRAEEGGSGHYLPGSMSSFMDSVPAGETFITRLNALYYEGTFAKDLTIPFAGLRAGDVDANSFASGLTVLWRPPLDLGEKWSYAMSATVPWVWPLLLEQLALRLARQLEVLVLQPAERAGR